MRILVVGSCGKKKLNQSTISPTCEDLASVNDIKTWREKSVPPPTRVRDLYTGNQNRELVHGVDLLRQIEKTEVMLSIISAGFGLVAEQDTLPTYECSFSGMKKSQILKRAKLLGIPSDFEELITSGYDLVYLALGKKYFLTLGDEWKSKSSTTIIGFDSSLSEEQMLCIPSAHEIVSSFSQNSHKIHGVTGFKGDLLRILANHALNQENSYRELLAWTHPVYFRDLVMKLGNLKIWH
ncbi:MAG: hypothetical protein ACTSSE_14825 [Candidatus Thorarchaeota archaeon]